MQPLKSLEQLMPFFVFLGLQLMLFWEHHRKKHNPTSAQLLAFQVKTAGAAALGLVVIVILLTPTGYFGPLSSRVRGLFVQHTRTGNPLVDSVAEHQPASSDAYFQNLYYVYYLAPVGFLYTVFVKNKTDAGTFLVLWGVTCYFFSSKMARLIILLGPIASVLGGIGFAVILEWAVQQLTLAPGWFGLMDEPEAAADEKKGQEAVEEESKKDGKGNKGGKRDRRSDRGEKNEQIAAVQRKQAKKNKNLGVIESITERYNGEGSHMHRTLGSVVVLMCTAIFIPQYWNYCHEMAKHMSHPSIMFQAKLSTGQEIIVDDYREAYWWLRDNTPKDSRVMAWWDYGYQIAGIAERTTIADGNTWNHEHIATLARCLVSEEKTAHDMIRHLADYVLVWTGGGGDDLGKSIHIARIGNSVYKGLCSDAGCSKFGMTQSGPTKSMATSLVYNLVKHGEEGAFALPSTYIILHT
jgi:dolichyl-diphosphooligosaccharide--protein glycosyltransferase